ncbi:MAG: response regulator [Spirochaetales bacterium]|nr:response regulator [Spirochaetales bacterium]
MEQNFIKNTILVVEDEVIIAENLILRLKSLGYNTLPYVSTGKNALEILSKSAPDLVLMDIRIKGEMDGIETAIEISDKYTTPIIYLTSLSDELTISRAKKTGAYGFIAKTTNLNNLYTTIEMAIHRNRMEAQVKEKEEILSVTLRSISDAVIGAQMDGTIISWNKGAYDIFGYELYEVVGKNLSILTPSSFPNEMPENLDRIGRGQLIDHYDTLRKNKNGELLNVSIKISPIKDILKKITGVSIIANDISEKKKLEKEILKISENESLRIGQDLHDNLGQHLTGLMFQLKVLENNLRKKNLVFEAEMAQNIAMETKDAVNLTRNLAKNLIKVNIDNQGISTAIAELISFYSSIYEIKFIYEDNEDIDTAIKDSVIINQLYHITQEALNNSIKHSNASIIEVLLSIDDSEICLQIADNGNGNLQNSKNNSNGLGLSILRYRTNVIDGNISIISSKNKGTEIICRVPIINQ